MAQDNFFDQFDDAPEDDFFNQFEDDTPEPVAAAPVVNTPTPPERGIVGRAWDALNKPLVDLAPAASKAADYIDTPELDDTGWGARLKGFGAGAIQGLGDVVSGLTSPLELGLAAASGGSSFAARRGLTGVARGLAAAEGGLGLAESAHGLGEIGGGIKEGNLARIGMGIVETAGGGAGMKQGFDGFTTKPKSIPTPEPAITEPTPASRGLVDNVDDWVDTEINTALSQPVKSNSTDELFTELKTKMQPQEDEATDLFDRYARGELSDNDYAIAQNVLNKKYGIKDQDLPVSDTMTFGEPEPVVAAAPVKPKPKIKVRLNRETNSLEPDLDDELTAKLFNSVKTGADIPANQKINPDDDIDLDELTQGHMFQLESFHEPMTKFASEGVDLVAAKKLQNARQSEMLAARVPDDVYINPKTNEPIDFKEARNLEKLEQGEFDGILTPRDLNKREMIRQIAGLPRAIQSAMDLSFPFRQGLGLSHTKGWRNAWGAMVKGMGSQKAYDTVMDSVRLNPDYKLAEEAGISFTDLTTKREEELGSSLAGKIPVFGGAIKFSNRGYNAFANKLRMDVFSDLVRKNPSAKTNLVEARAFADFVNNASGRGNLGRAEKSAELLNDLFFSPRLMASRIQLMNPMNYQFLRTPLQREYLKSAATVAGTWMTVAGLAKQAGADVSFDPESADFGQIKFNGKTRIDLSGGFRPFLNLFYRLGKGGVQTVLKGKSDRYSKTPFTTAGSDFGNFLQNKESPLAKITLSPWQADKNRPFEAGDQALKLITPIIIQRASEIIQEDPSMWWILGPEFVGMGTDTYEKGKKPSRLLPESIFPRKNDFSFPR